MKGRTGKYLTTLRGHVGAVFPGVLVCGQSITRTYASKDSTMKVWEMNSRKRITELPGHADEVYALGWSPDGVIELPLAVKIAV